MVKTTSRVSTSLVKANYVSQGIREFATTRKLLDENAMLSEHPDTEDVVKVVCTEVVEDVVVLVKVDNVEVDVVMVVVVVVVVFVVKSSFLVLTLSLTSQTDL